MAPDGRTPFADWLRKLTDRKVRNGIRVRIARLRLGNLEDYKPVGHGVLKLRIDVGQGYRVHIGQDGSRLILLTRPNLFAGHVSLDFEAKVILK